MSPTTSDRCTAGQAQCANADTLMDIQHELGEIRGELTTSLKGICETLDRINGELKHRQEKHDTRLEAIEKIILIGNGEPSLRQSVRDLVKDAKEQKSRSRANSGMVFQVVLVLIQVGMAFILDSTRRDVKAIQAQTTMQSSAQPATAQK
jgi:hypothetical protein